MQSFATYLNIWLMPWLYHLLRLFLLLNQLRRQVIESMTCFRRSNRLVAALHDRFGLVQLQDNGSCWDMHKAAYSGSQKAAVGRVAASPMQIVSCFTDVNNILHQQELHLFGHMCQVV